MTTGPESADSPRIVLSTLNAKFIHASLGLRYLHANMARHGQENLPSKTVLREFTTAQNPLEIARSILELFDPHVNDAPKIIGFGIYIWNIAQTTEVVRHIKTTRPEIIVVLGGPEVSHEYDQQEIVALADYLITGWGDVSFPQLCSTLLQGLRPEPKIIVGVQPELSQINLPYDEYTADDLAHRLIYVEASRGCPFKCEFCLSSLDKTAWAFDLDVFLAALDRLQKRGARNFKFVDRTFNLRIDDSVQILQFFLNRLTPDLFVHFEIIPDNLPDRLKSLLVEFPQGVLQFEVGIQSFDARVQQRISRKQNHQKTVENLTWLISNTRIHLHTDLIFGLPGETLETFAEGFNLLHSLAPHEIQIGALKRLRGTPIIRHAVEYSMAYDPQPPYTIRQTSTMSADTVQQLGHFSRNWERVANSGRFRNAIALLLQQSDLGNSANAATTLHHSQVSAFHAFLKFSNWLWFDFEKTSGKTNGITPEHLVDALFCYLTDNTTHSESAIRAALATDYLASGARGRPDCLRSSLPNRINPTAKASRKFAQRQNRLANVLSTSIEATIDQA